MSNEITSILQAFAPQHKASQYTGGAPQPSVVEKPSTNQGDRVSLSNSARQMQLAESKPEPISTPRLDSSDVGMTGARNETSVQPASMRLSAQGSTHRPSPAMANMMESFLSTSDMKDFDVNSDLNADGVINFHDLAALREKESGALTAPTEHPKALLNNMTDAFSSTEGSEEFDAASDLNADGMINFHDLAILRSKMESMLDADINPLKSSD